MCRIEFKNPLLARLFGGAPEPKQEASPPEDAAAPPPPPPPPSAPPRNLLQLPPEHAIYKLWELREKEAGWLPKPLLRLEDPAGLCEAMSDGDMKKELLRLQISVNASANERLKCASVPKAAEGEEPPPPPDLDAQALVFITSSGLVAWLLLYPPVGEGQPLDRDALDEALEDSQVCVGIDEKLLDSLTRQEDRYFQLFPIACGTPAVPGIDGRVVDLFPRVVERKITADEHNRVDYMSLNFVHNVEEGSVICRIIPPSEGEPGCTVQDQPIPTKDGRAAIPPKGRNTELSEDGTQLLASIAGHVEFSGRSFQVKPLLDIAGNVDYSTGNINFLGDVHIHGDICSGFTVRAMGNITVDGVVEACTVEAGGDLVVVRGIQGDERAVIRAQENLYAKYLENSCIYVKESLHTDCIINCDVYCDGGVEVRSGRMTVIGGQIKAAHEISAGTVGSRTECRTDLFLGGHPCGEFDYDLLTQEIGQLEETLEATERQPDSPDKFSRVSKIRMQLMLDRSRVEQLDKERQSLRVEEEDPGIRRLVCDTVYAGTVLTIGAVTYRFEDTLSPCSATLSDGEIQLI